MSDYNKEQVVALEPNAQDQSLLCSTGLSLPNEAACASVETTLKQDAFGCHHNGPQSTHDNMKGTKTIEEVGSSKDASVEVGENGVLKTKESHVDQIDRSIGSSDNRCHHNGPQNAHDENMKDIEEVGSKDASVGGGGNKQSKSRENHVEIDITKRNIMSIWSTDMENTALNIEFIQSKQVQENISSAAVPLANDKQVQEEMSSIISASANKNTLISKYNLVVALEPNAPEIRDQSLLCSTGFSHPRKAACASVETTIRQDAFGCHRTKNTHDVDTDNMKDTERIAEVGSKDASVEVGGNKQLKTRESHVDQIDISKWNILSLGCSDKEETAITVELIQSKQVQERIGNALVPLPNDSISGAKKLLTCHDNEEQMLYFDALCHEHNGGNKQCSNQNEAVSDSQRGWQLETGQCVEVEQKTSQLEGQALYFINNRAPHSGAIANIALNTDEVFRDNVKDTEIAGQGSEAKGLTIESTRNNSHALIECGDNEQQIMDFETVFCDCGKPAVEKTISKYNVNRGLRFFSCSNYVPFYLKKRLKTRKMKAGPSCHFFRWIDPPRVSKEQRIKAKADRLAHKEALKQTRTPLKIYRTRAQLQAERESAKEKSLAGSELKSSALSVPSGQEGDASAKDGRIIIIDEQAEACVKRKMVDSDNALTDQVNISKSKKQKLQPPQCIGNALLQVTGETCVVAVAPAVNAQKANTGNDQRGNEKNELDVPFCNCTGEVQAVLRTVRYNTPNKGLRYWACGSRKHKKLKKSTCGFFRWHDVPRYIFEKKQ